MVSLFEVFDFSFEFFERWASAAEAVGCFVSGDDFAFLEFQASATSEYCLWKVIVVKRSYD